MNANPPLKLAVVTGGHSYDVVNLHQLVRSLPGAFDAYVQHMDDFASTPKGVRQAYDVVLFYIMLAEGPTDDGLPWYAGKPKTALSELGETRQGIVLLHHALLAYPHWPRFDDLVGIHEPRRHVFGYFFNQNVRVTIANRGHPITQGLADWEMVDETYTMGEPSEDNEILLTTEHPKSMKALAWVRHFKESRVFCLQSGHDNLCWTNPHFRTVLERGIRWSAHRL